MVHKKLLAAIFFFIVICIAVVQAAEWEILRQASVPSHLRDVFFVDQNTGWIVGGSGMILHTTDGGLTWAKQDGRTKKALRSVYFINHNEGWIVGSGEIYRKGGELRADKTGGIVLHTADAGLTWKRQKIGLNYVSLQVVKFINAKEGWVGGFDCDTSTRLILHTTDGGQTWKRQEVPTVAEWARTILDISFVNAKNGWAVAMDGVFATKDGGETWKLIRKHERKEEKVQIRDEMESIYFVNENEGWIGGSTSEIDARGKAKMFCSIYHTADGGSSWKETRLLKETTFNKVTDIQFINPQEGWVIVFDRRQGGIVFHTSDGGKSYDKQFNLPRYMYVDKLQMLSFVGEEHGWFVGHSGRIWSTSDGGKTWLSIGNEESELATLTAVSFVNDSLGWAVGDWGTVIHTTDDGTTWQQHKTGVPPYEIWDVQFVNNEEGWLTAGGDSPSCFHTLDGGRTWKLEQDNAGRALHFINANEGWCAGGRRFVNNKPVFAEIYHTTDGGITWLNRTPGNFRNPPHNFYDVCFVTPQEGWIVGHKGLAGFGQEAVIYHTADGGRRWKRQRGGIPANISNFSEVYFFDEERGWVLGTHWAGGIPGFIFATTDGGKTWLLQKQTKNPLWSILFVSAQEGWAVGDNGKILYTNDGGEHWQEQDSGTNADLLKLEYAGGRYIWAVGQWGTVLRLAPPSLEGRGVKPSDELLITNWGKLKTTLYQNYPNPFNPETFIPYQLASDSKVSIKIYDVSGRLIRTLNIGQRKAGLYVDREKAAHWNGTNQQGEQVTSGIYFYQLVADDFSATKRMLIVK